MSWYRRLIDLTIWNSLAAGLNFFSNILLVRTGGISMFGTYALLLSSIGMLSLIQVLIPSSFAIVRMQDDKLFPRIYTSFFMGTMVMITLLCFILSLIVHTPVGVLIVMSWSVIFPFYADALFQAQNRLRSYFVLLFLIALSRIIAVMLWAYTDKTRNIEYFIILSGISSLAITFIFLVPYRHLFSIDPKAFLTVFDFLRKESVLLRQYYFSSAIKTINGHLITLVASTWVNREVLGVYSLLMKVNTFITGLARTPETVMIHREGIRRFADDIYKNTWWLGLLVQVAYLFVGPAYLYFSTGESFWKFHFFLSFLVYPYLFFSQARAKRIIRYDNSLQQISMAAFSVCVLVFTLLKFLIGFHISLVVITSLFAVASFFQYAVFLWLDRKSISQNIQPQVQ